MDGAESQYVKSLTGNFQQAAADISPSLGWYYHVPSSSTLVAALGSFPGRFHTLGLFVHTAPVCSLCIHFCHGCSQNGCCTHSVWQVSKNGVCAIRTSGFPTQLTDWYSAELVVSLLTLVIIGWLVGTSTTLPPYMDKPISTETFAVLLVILLMTRAPPHLFWGVATQRAILYQTLLSTSMIDCCTIIHNVF